MDDGIVASIILGICFWGLTGIIKTISEHRLINNLIEKRSEEIKPDSLNLQKASVASNLKWGIIILFSGIGLVLIHFLKLSSESPLPYGIESIFIAVGFILLFFIEKHSITNSNKIQ